jgi:alpha-tubulin suppressor-like RCC1 family protein
VFTQAVISDIAAGSHHSTLISGTGATAVLYTWGVSAEGALGRGPIATSQSCPGTPLSGNYTRVFARRHQTFAPTAAGTLFAWGLNNEGQLGLGSPVDLWMSPQQAMFDYSIGSIQDVALGNDWSMILHQ